MKFANDKAIFLQIADTICEQIIAGHWQEGERLHSVREMAVNMAVNPNTVMRSYGFLEAQHIIQMQRGVGYFITEGAKDKILNMRKEQFINEELPRFYKTLELLGISFDEVKKLYEDINNETKQ